MDQNTMASVLQSLAIVSPKARDRTQKEVMAIRFIDDNTKTKRPQIPGGDNMCLVTSVEAANCWALTALSLG